MLTLFRSPADSSCEGKGSKAIKMNCDNEQSELFVPLPIRMHALRLFLFFRVLPWP